MRRLPWMELVCSTSSEAAAPAGSQKSGRSCWSLCRGGSGEGKGIPNECAFSLQSAYKQP